MPQPDFTAFKRIYDAGRSQMLRAERIADLDTPVSAYMRLAKGERFSFLLESVEGGAVKGRYSIIGLAPDLLWRCEGGKVAVNKNPMQNTFEPLESDAISALREVVNASRIDEIAGLPPAVTALVGYLGYDMIALVEDLHLTKADNIGVPDALLMRPTLIAVYDGVKDVVTIATPVRPVTGVSAEEAYQAAKARIEAALERLNTPTPHEPAHVVGNIDRELSAHTPPGDYMRVVEKAQDYILAGDIFQVVLSQRFSMAFPLDPLALYRALRRTNPSPFLFLLNFEDFAVIGSSPEILVRLRDGQVTIRPIAGTRPRGKTPLEDKRLADDLLNDPKELSEHLMLLDLGRNDVGRVAKPGSVTVTEREIIEYYSHVMHIVSNVVGELADGEDATSALFAGFPAGTVSGAPKIRAMEIIEELEREKRGVYGGAVGYFGVDGSMDSCIALRTAVLKDGQLYIQSGAGIVADSVPLSEQKECEAKAGALITAAKAALDLAGKS